MGVFVRKLPRQPATQAVILTPGSRNRTPGVAAPTKEGSLEANQSAPKDPFNNRHRPIDLYKHNVAANCPCHRNSYTIAGQNIM